MPPAGDRAPDRFPTTHWSLVARGAAEENGCRQAALEQLLLSYLPAMKAHLVYRKSLPPERAEDLLQDFVAAKILEGGLIAQADRQLGRFRTFLLTALDRFLINWIRDQHAAKRSPAGGLAPMEQWMDCPGPTENPSDAFDVAWAQQVIQMALQSMRAECETSGRHQLWAVFECRVVGPILEGRPSPDYRQMVEQFHFASPTQASNVLVTAKRMYARALRSVIARYATDDQEIDAELSDLQAILARCGSAAT